jgi:lipid-A-disaccharide synthase
MPKKIFITAGEVSGDLNASNLVRTLRGLDESFEFVGIGGRHLRDAGVRLLSDSTTWGSIGFIEGFIKGLTIYPIARRLGRMFAEEKPDVFVPVDYRFFNMRAARIAKGMGIPVVYFFAPVSWFGSGGKRFAALAETVDLSLVALPLSLDDYRAAGARFEYIGHPLIDTVKPSMPEEEARGFFGVGDAKPVIGLMPGSRQQEVVRLMPVFAAGARKIREVMPGARFVVFRASDALDSLIRKHIGEDEITVAHEHVYDFMNICDLLILCSGTATHEATLMQKPMVVCYMINAVTNWIARKTIDPPMIALPNILAGEFIVPEVLQEFCTPDAVAGKAIEILSSDEIRDRMKEKLGQMKEKMGNPGVLARAARLVADAASGKLPG